jgi:N-sulfoglucosamine sulfohydrolase
MRRRVTVRSAVAFTLAAIVPAPAAVGSERPNFVFVIADDCTYRDIGCYGGQAHTPNIDRLASEGMRFTRCFQAAPMCSPTRHNIYTGLYPVKSGAYPNHTFAKAGTKSVVHYLRPLGYRVALSGKRHINPPGVFPFENLAAVGNNPNFDLIDKFMAECQEAGTPFCLFACSNEPHSPWNKGDPSRYHADELELPPYFVDTPVTRRNMVNYLAEITYYDGQVGECLALLDKHALADNTLVIVVSEQGSSFPFGKWTCYDTGIQSAFIARWPGRIKPGTVSDAMIEYVDVLPTYVELAGGVPDPVLDGKSLARVLLGQSDEHKKYVFGEMTTRGIINGSEHFGIRSIRSQRFKYIWNFTPETKFRNACVRSAIFRSWRDKAAGDTDAADKVRRYEHRPGEELYDVTKDPYEWDNLADDPQYATVKETLRRELLAWMEASGDKGQQTELEAFEHQARALRAQRDSQAGKKAGKAKRRNAP